MPKRNPLKDAAYKAFPGMSRDEAEAKGYVVVEYSLAGGQLVPVFGYYLDTLAGGALDVTVPVSTDTKVVAGGTLGPADISLGNKGALANPNDPVVHGTADADSHADGGAPVDPAAQPEVVGYDAAAPDKTATAKTK